MKYIIKTLRNTLRSNCLFMKIFLVMVISIFSVSILLTYSTIRMSSMMFMETFSITNTKVLDQIKNRFESYSYSVVAAMNDVQNNGTIKRVLLDENTNSMEAAKSQYQLMQQMNRIFPNLSYFDANMVLVGNYYHLYNMNYLRWPVTYDELQEHSITRNTIREPNRILFQFDPGNSLNNEPLLVASKALFERSNESVYGVVYVSIQEKQLRHFYQDYTSPGNDILLINSYGEVVSSNKEELIGTEATELLQFSQEWNGLSDNNRNIKLHGNEFLLLSEYIPTFDMYLVNLIDTGIVMGDYIDTKRIVLISFSVTLIAVIIVFIISRRLTKSISRLVRQISTMAKNDFTKPVEETGGYEVKQIASAFNSMLDELQEYVDIIIETQKKQRNAELQSLQHQINPHFLYNTLTSIKLLVQQGEKEKATDAVHALITLLQNSLGTIQQTITVEEEYSNIKNYVLINQTRYGERIKVMYFISPDCLGYYLPKLVTQPFIENAFFHAFTKKNEGYIQILISRKENKLVCEIIDNGDGMIVAETNKMASNTGKRHLFSGIGIRNVHERIQLLYGENYGVEIFSELGKGTRVKIELPLLDSDNKVLKKRIVSKNSTN